MFATLALLAALTIDDARARAAEEKKPLLILFRTAVCERCDAFERDSLPHPAVQRRLPSVVFAVLPASAGEDAHVALFDRTGAPRVRWPIVPDTTSFGLILDATSALAEHLENAARFTESGRVHDADVETAIIVGRLSRPKEAMALLARAEANVDEETRRRVNAARALFVTKPPPRATNELPPIRILPPRVQVVSGAQIVRTHVTSDAIACVTFALDGREVARVTRPPFSAELQFGRTPERHTIAVVAFDREGKEIGRDERVVNDAGETFSLRITAPQSSVASGDVRVTMSVRAPAARRIERVVLSWNDAKRAVLTRAPWSATVRIPEGQLGVLRAVAELDDGRTVEDAVLLNAGGATDRSDVQLVELPLNVDGDVRAEEIVVREGAKTRRVESIATAAETPLTLGLLFDVSGSMQKTLPDLQEAAIRFLEQTLGPRDRAFLVAFDTRARLVQPATSEVAALRRQILGLLPEGLTALHDALVLGLLQFEGVHGRRAMIVFSDGHDVSSGYRAADVSELARRMNVPVHVISSLQGVPAGASATVDPTDRELKRIAHETGGTGHTLLRLEELPSIYARIEAALRAQLIAFIRTERASRENEWRAIRVEVEGRSVLAPAGYYAPW